MTRWGLLVAVVLAAGSLAGAILGFATAPMVYLPVAVAVGTAIGWAVAAVVLALAVVVGTNIQRWRRGR